MFTLNLDPSLGGQCSLFLNLADIALPEEKILSELGITEAQLAFARRPRITTGGEHTDLISTLYYHFGCYRVVGHVVTSTGFIKSHGLTYWRIPIEQEDSVLVGGTVTNQGIDDHLGIAPKRVLISQRVVGFTPYGDEYVFIHRDAVDQRSFLQYRYPPTAAAALFSRLHMLQARTDSVIIGNGRLRNLVK